MGISRTMAAFALAAAVTGTSAGRQLPSVDIDTARAQIEQFEEETSELQARIEVLSSSSERIREDMQTWITWREGLNTASQLLDERASELYDILAGLASRTVIQRAQAVLDRYSRLSELITDRIEVLDRRVEEGRDTISRNELTVASYRARSERNRSNVELLRTAVAQSLEGDNIIRDYLDAFEEELEQAEQALRAATGAAE